MNYPDKLPIVRHPLTFQNTRKRLKRRNIAFNFPIIIATSNRMFNDLSSYNEDMKAKGYSGILSHYQIDKDGIVYECRDLAYQNGFAEHPLFLADDIIKNAIVIQIEASQNADLNNLPKIKNSLKILLTFLCMSELLCPITDIKDMGDYFCDEAKSFNAESFISLKNEIMKSLYNGKTYDWRYADEKNYAIIVVPDYDDEFRTIEHISKVMTMSSDFDKWYPYANLLRASNLEIICDFLDTLYTDNERDDMISNGDLREYKEPMRPGTLIVGPQSAYISYVKSIIRNAGLDMARQKIVDTASDNAFGISTYLKDTYVTRNEGGV